MAADRSTSPLTLPLDGYTRWGELKQFVPLCLSSVTNRERAGRFPKRVKLGSYSVAWPNREIHRWFADPNGYRAQHTDEVTA
ncbi:TPA: AlpA family phage regulatory protein [Burkholderia cepacia ATCC 25416]|uniref:helix-turn-helix transcriptional regulator n=1 Tax=Burkholderia TaxID=32008 RepID=UPI000B7A1D1D|nr:MULTISPECIES: AlpA family phage regulatory protein [Burkholderia]HDR9767886.1 AlpA family phage regulatory protein [Burkholderia cepacia ATCC 25416]MBJ9691549.1 AlpA family phage regulatory protein [Burkholderia cenocepacia]OXI24106.1 transcriptional regulator [Burkholderia sp. AU15512]HDR9775441.1 AlpA family phage regulatory protein [Burkholderia cepacia ATCC 25416]HDR9784043.1 AlpA family phage regulatory protein [Burkholderia cepacia ATCC 25416]